MRRFLFIIGGIVALVIVVGILGVVFVVPSIANRYQPPPPKPTNRGIGFPAITPHLNMTNPGLATFNANDVEQYVLKYGSPAGPLVKGAHLTVVKLIFTSANEASVLMKGESTDLPDNAPVCYVLVHGPFNITDIHHPPNFHPSEASLTEIVFDGRTGNLIVWGIPGNAFM